MVDERRRRPERCSDAAVSAGTGERSRRERSGRVPPTAHGRSTTSRTPATTLAGSADRPGRPPTTLAASTGTIFRFLLLRGLSEAEAANLTAFLCGLPISERPWQLREVNQLLFLRELHRRGRLERGAVPPALDEAPPPLA